MEKMVEPTLVVRVLELLRRWGWETRREPILAELRAAQDDPVHRTALEFYAAWMVGERGEHSDAIARLSQLETSAPDLAAWCRVGRAFVALRMGDFARTHTLLDSATATMSDGSSVDEQILAAT